MNPIAHTRTRVQVVVAFLVLVSVAARSQQSGDSREMMRLLQSTQSATAIERPEAVALEGVVDPDLYIVGPADMLAVNIWTSPPLSYNLTVTPEGTLLVPTVGEVRVVDLTLAEAKRRVLARIRNRYVAGEPTVTLVSPRSVLVTVAGAVAKQGRQQLRATDRVEQAINAAGILLTSSSRHITLRRETGELLVVDIPKSYATRDKRLNPYLANGDEIFVPRYDPAKEIFAVYGGVNKPGRYELTAGDSLLSALDLAYGLTARAIGDSIALFRFTTASEMSKQLLSLSAMRAGQQPNIALELGDRIHVLERPELREDFRVEVLGEVWHPGTYPITREKTRVSEVLARAGGLTPYASIPAMELVRTTTSPWQIQLERLMSLRGNITPEDSSYYVLESELRIAKEVVTVDFPRLVLRRDTTQDVTLRDGDRIVVPSVRRSVYVFGQVQTPGNVPFVAGQDADTYIRLAGGFTPWARSGDVVVIKRVTHQWMKPGDTTIEEGDQVWVPKVVEHSFAWYMNIIGQTASIVSVAVTVVLLVIQLRK